MKKIGYNLPIFEDTDKADLNKYSTEMAGALKVQLDKFGNPLIFKGTVQTLEELDILTNMQNGYIYQVLNENANYIWNGTEWKIYSQNIDLENSRLSKIYISTTITAPTCEGFGKIKKLYGKTEEIGEGEKSPDNPYEISCVGDNINLFNKNKLEIIEAWQCSYTIDNNKKISMKVTATGGVAFVKTNAITLKKGSYAFSAKTEGQLVQIRILNSDNKEICFNHSNKFTFTLENDTTLYLLFYVNNSTTTNYLNIEKIQIEKGTVTTEYREYGKGIIQITSTDGTNTSNKVITCKPLCCLKDSEGNIIAQDYIDFTKGKIHRECGYISSYNSESITTDYVSSTGSLTTGATIVYKLAEAIEEDINTTNSIVQYADETTISNSDNAEMEVELTKNKAISSINENIGALQEKDNEFIKTVSNSNGTAIKFADGTMICTKTVTFSSVNITTADGSLYISSYLELGNFAESFIAKPVMNINKINNWAAFVLTTTDVTNSSAGRIVLAKGDTVSKGTFNLDIIAIGRWK